MHFIARHSKVFYCLISECLYQYVWFRSADQIISFQFIDSSAGYLKYLTLHLNKKMTKFQLLILYLFGCRQNYCCSIICLISEFFIALLLVDFQFFLLQNLIVIDFLAAYLVCLLGIINDF